MKTLISIGMGRLWPRPHGLVSFRSVQTTCTGAVSDVGLVLGVYAPDDDHSGTIMYPTPSFNRINEETKGKLFEVLRQSGPVLQPVETRMFFGLHEQYPAICVVGLGDECLGYDDFEERDLRKETIRQAAAAASRELQKLSVRTIFLESFDDAESTAEGANMGVWLYQELRQQNKQRVVPRLELYDSCDYTSWQIGMQKAAAQNLARQLAEAPANILTPSFFAQSAVEVLTKAGVSVEVRVRQWIKMQGMNGILAAGRGSCEPPLLLEANYFGCEEDVQPIVLVGKGVTYDSGGLCLKPDKELIDMRGDMSGAAILLAATRASAALQLPINIRYIAPLTENMPGTCAMKPGDIVTLRNGKTVAVEDTDFDGRLAMADALAYSSIYSPKFILDVGGLTVEMRDAMGRGATGVFSNNDQLFEQMRIAGIHTGDRVWRFPYWKIYDQYLRAYPGADVTESYRTPGAPASASHFLVISFPELIGFI